MDNDDKYADDDNNSNNNDNDMWICSTTDRTMNMDMKRHTLDILIIVLGIKVICREILHLLLDFHYHVQWNLISISEFKPWSSKYGCPFHKPHDGALFAQNVSMGEVCISFTYGGL